MATGVATSSKYSELFFGGLYEDLASKTALKMEECLPTLKLAYKGLGSYQRRIEVEKAAQNSSALDQLVTEYWAHCRSTLLAVELESHVVRLDRLLKESISVISRDPSALTTAVEAIDVKSRDLLKQVNVWKAELSTLTTKMIEHVASAKPVLQAYCGEVVPSASSWFSWGSASAIPHKEESVAPVPNFQAWYTASHDELHKAIKQNLGISHTLLEAIGELSTRLAANNNAVQHNKATADLQTLPVFFREGLADYQGLLIRVCAIKEFIHRAIGLCEFIEPNDLVCPPAVEVPGFSFKRGSDVVCTQYLEELQPLLRKMQAYAEQAQKLMGVANGHLGRTSHLAQAGGSLSLLGRAWSNLSWALQGAPSMAERTVNSDEDLADPNQNVDSDLAPEPLDPVVKAPLKRVRPATAADPASAASEPFVPVVKPVPEEVRRPTTADIVSGRSKPRGTPVNKV